MWTVLYELRAGTVDFLHTSIYDAVFCICDRNSIDNIGMMWLLLSSAYTAPRLFQLLTPPWQRGGGGHTSSWEGAQPGQLTPADQRDIPRHTVSRSAIKLGAVCKGCCCLGTGWGISWLVASNWVLGGVFCSLLEWGFCLILCLVFCLLVFLICFSSFFILFFFVSFFYLLNCLHLNPLFSLVPFWFSHPSLWGRMRKQLDGALLPATVKPQHGSKP